MEKKVVVKGINIISSLGLNLEKNWNNLVKGKSGIKKIDLFDVSQNSTQIAGQLPKEFEEYSKKFSYPTLINLLEASRSESYTHLHTIFLDLSVKRYFIENEGKDLTNVRVGLPKAISDKNFWILSDKIMEILKGNQSFE